MHFPLILVNYKAYSEVIGQKGVKLAKLMEGTSKAYAVAPQLADIKLIASNTKLDVYAQHMDPIMPGSHTGHVLAESIEEAGAVGTLLNHSERRIPLRHIKEGIKIADAHGLETIVCVRNPKEALIVARLEPDAIAIEPPDLIGSGISVSTTMSEMLEEALDRIDSVPLLCGAGITHADDIRRALGLGMKGVLVASGIVKTSDPAKAIEELASGLRD